MIKLWLNKNKNWHKSNVAKFYEFMERNDPNRFFHPNEALAPWHVQRWVNGRLVNFYPHLMKAYHEEFGVLIGVKALDSMMKTLLATDEEEFDVIDDSQSGY